MTSLRVAILADERQRAELLNKPARSVAQFTWLADRNISARDFDACFDLTFRENRIDQDSFISGLPVFANAVLTTGEQLPENYIRINGWCGFLQNKIMEVAAANETIKGNAAAVLEQLGWDFAWTPDVPGMIAPRIISMIVNEAYFALAEAVSTKEQIDMAMKLGTNYPFGPFEWSQRIGLSNIYALLEILRDREDRYNICPLLAKEAGHRID